MTDETTILRKLYVEDEHGYRRPLDQFYPQSTKSYGVPLTATEHIIANQANYTVDEKRFLPVGVDVRNDDMLEINEIRYDILSIRNAGTPGLMAHIEVDVRRRVGDEEGY